MNTPISWIKAYVPDMDVSIQQYVDDMTLSGSHVESYVELDKNLDKIVVGQIDKLERHPDADKLVICQVNVGEEEDIQIVTGAPNVKEHDMIPVVLVGGRVAGGHDGSPNPEGGIKIKKGKLRGVESYGMMCSVEELGSSNEMYPDAPEDGVFIFGADYNVKPGDDAVEALGLRDQVVEFEITSNRVDCFSMIGMAREAAVTFGKEFHPPVVTETGNDEDVNDFIKVEVKDPDLCKRFTARVVKNIRIAPSPHWMQRRLAAVGIRPINNIVDITNYVMMEYGQPMHAYDLDTIAGHKLIVRRANDGDTFVTLDGQERNVDSSVLMICDDEKEVGLAGIMGGANSMVTDEMTTLLLECANFDGTNIRLSSKKVGLRTDASGIFEKGLDPHNAIDAMNRACQLIEDLGAGEVVGGVVDVCSELKDPVRLPLEADKINALLGTDLSREEMLSYLTKLEIVYEEDTNTLVIPTFRQDLNCMADIAEEVARFYGYSNIPVSLPRGEATVGKLSFKARVEAVARDIAEENGFSGAMSYSFESPKVYDRLLLPEDAKERQAIVISNPLGEDYSIMRTVSLNGILTSLGTNYNRRNKEVRLYELGNVYIPESLPLTTLPEEKMCLTFGMYGDCDFFTLKGVLEDLYEHLGMDERVEYIPFTGYPFLHPGRQAKMMAGDVQIGWIGQAHPQVAENYNIKAEVYLAVIDMPAMTQFATFDRKYEGIAKFPAVHRDLSMVVEKGIFVGQIEKVLKQCGGAILEDVTLFDVYEGNQIREGYKSVAYSLTFRAKDHTLEDTEVSRVVDKMMKELNKMGIELRA